MTVLHPCTFAGTFLWAGDVGASRMRLLGECKGCRRYGVLGCSQLDAGDDAVARDGLRYGGTPTPHMGTDRMHVGLPGRAVTDREIRRFDQHEGSKSGVTVAHWLAGAQDMLFERADPFLHKRRWGRAAEAAK